MKLFIPQFPALGKPRAIAKRLMALAGIAGNPVMNVLSAKQTAALLGVTDATLRFWRCKGKGPPFTKLSDSKQAGVRYDLADIEAWKAQRKFTSTSAATVNHPGNG